MTRPLLLDLYCGAGGAAMGYFIAGFDVIGVDHKPQPDYPFKFILVDDITELLGRIPWHKVSAVHASPPCQRHSIGCKLRGTHTMHPDMLPFTRRLIRPSGIPYVIENVPGAPLHSPVTLCGSMFNLYSGRFELKRHRLFETNWDVGSVPSCRCGRRQAVSVAGHGGVYGKPTKHAGLALCNKLMGTPWITTRYGVSQAIPPAYTAFLGTRLLCQV